MDTSSYLIIFGSVAVAIVVRLSNILIEWLAKVLGVKEPEPIKTPGEALGAKVVGKPVTIEPDSPPPAK